MRSIALPLLAVVGFGGGTLLAFNQLQNGLVREVKAAASGPVAGRYREAGQNPNIQEFGRNNLEAQITRAGVLQIFVLGPDAKAQTPIRPAALEAQLQPEGKDAQPITLRPQPMPGESAEKCSRLVAEVPTELRDQLVGLTITVADGGTFYRLRFPPYALGTDAFVSAAKGVSATSAATPPASAMAVATAMPAAPSSGEEDALFRKPGGGYTLADIAANGSMTPSQKFAGLIPQHSTEPIKGERICPITKTRADARFTWVVGGKKYLFCCPPCVSEFVKRAKENPDAIKEPATYVKR